MAKCGIAPKRTGQNTGATRPSGRVGCTHRGRFRAPDSPAQRIAGKLSCAASEITAHAYL